MSNEHTTDELNDFIEKLETMQKVAARESFAVCKQTWAINSQKYWTIDNWVLGLRSGELAIQDVLLQRLAADF